METVRKGDRSPTRVGVFGGTFDPPHRGHVSVARDVADALGLERVLWIPAGVPPHKPAADTTDAAIRLRMVRAAALDDPRFEASAIELERDGPSYTVDTVRALKEALPDAELFVILGVDQYAELGTWHDPDGIRAAARLAVMDRAGTSPKREGADADTVFVSVGRVDVSSTEVRDRLASGLDVSDLVPEGVLAIIDAEGLYANGADPGHGPSAASGPPPTTDPAGHDA